MTLKEALRKKYPDYTDKDIKNIIQTMVDSVDEEGLDPEEALLNEGLEPDYVFDLLDELR